MVYGYIRVANFDMTDCKKMEQETEINMYSTDKLFYDIGFSGMTISPQLNSLLNKAKEGDTIVIKSISRFGRDIKIVNQVVNKLKKNNVKIIVIDSALNMRLM